MARREVWGMQMQRCGHALKDSHTTSGKHSPPLSGSTQDDWKAGWSPAFFAVVHAQPCIILEAKRPTAVQQAWAAWVLLPASRPVKCQENAMEEQKKLASAAMEQMFAGIVMLQLLHLQFVWLSMTMAGAKKAPQK